MPKLIRLGVLIGLFFSSMALAYAESTSDAAYQPQPVSEAERHAAGLVLLYFEEGPRAWWPELAADSPLRRLGEAAAVTEMSVRLGSPEGAEWKMLTPAKDREKDTALFSVQFPSGLDDLIELDLVRENGGWKILRLKSLADPRTVTLPIGLQIIGSAPVPEILPTHDPRSSPRLVFHLWWAVLALLLVVSITGLRGPGRGQKRLAGRDLAKGVGIGALALLAFGCDGFDLDRFLNREEEQPLPKVDPNIVSPLAALQPLRIALASSQKAEDMTLQTLVDRMELDESNPTAKEVASAWLAQRLLILGRLKEARAIVDDLPKPSTLPITELIRARLAWLQSRQDEVLDAYQQALTRAPFQDQLRIEAAAAYIMSGDDGSGESIFTQLVHSGSRAAEAYYFANRFATLAETHEKADLLFKIGWHLQPLSRTELFSDPLLSHSATRPLVFKLFQFSKVDEPMVIAENIGAEALPLPAGFNSRLLGDLLTITSSPSEPTTDDSGTPAPTLRSGDSVKTLIIPGGAALALPTADLESAEIRDRREKDRALAQLEVLTEEASRPGGLAHPARQQLARTAANALAESNRWSELLDLTRAVSDDPLGVPPDLIKLRAQALMEEDFEIEAKNLMIKLAQSDLENSRRDPGTYYQLAEMFAKTEDYDYAIRLMKKAKALSPYAINSGRIRQIELDRDLSQQYLTRETDHFILRYPEETGAKYPKHLGWVLEAEWKRLQKWIPTGLKDGKKIEVQLVPLEPFMKAYSQGVVVLGIYDGRVRVPLADLKSLHPLLVGILSHELAHAMIDIRTDGNAPKWLHEGLASHIEMEQPEINPIPEMHAVDRDLTFSIIDPVLAGFSEPQLVDLAYSHATWAVHYIERRHGVRGIHRLLDAFRRGDTTKRALKRAFGQTVAQFDKAWRDWCLNKAPSTWPTQLVRYENAFDSLLKVDDESGLSDTAIAALTEHRDDGRGARAAIRKPKEKSLGVRVKEWHGVYAAKTKPVKLQLRKTMSMIQGKTQGNIPAQCNTLGQSIRSLQQDSVALKAPTTKARQSLERAYGHFFNLATACKSGQSARIQAELQHATQALGRAQKDLSRFGVKP